MSRRRSIPWIAGAALIALLGAVVPVAALAGLCGSDAGCPMMSAVETHCRPEVVLTSAECCAEMRPAADVPQLLVATTLRQVASPAPSWLAGSNGLVRGVGIVADPVGPSARGTPLYTLHLALLN